MVKAQWTCVCMTAITAPAPAHTCGLRTMGSLQQGEPKGHFQSDAGGSQTDPRDRLDYQVLVTNPITGATETIANGKTLVWQGTNDPQYLRQAVLPGGRESVLCIPAPIILKTPSFAASSKNAGDYTGTLRVIYTPSTL